MTFASISPTYPTTNPYDMSWYVNNIHYTLESGIDIAPNQGIAVSFQKLINVPLFLFRTLEYVLHCFQNHLDYETFLKVDEMQRGQPCLKLMIEKMKFLLWSNSVKKDSNEDLYVYFSIHMYYVGSYFQKMHTFI